MPNFIFLSFKFIFPKITMYLYSLSTMLGYGALLVSTLVFHALGAQVSDNNNSVKTVFQLTQNETWFENLVVRPNGKILATRIDVPELWSIDPSDNTKNAGSLLYTFPNATSLLGITEIAHDNYAIVAGNFSLSTIKSTPGSYAVWTIDVSNKDKEPKAELLAPIPGGEFLDGMVPFGKDLLLIADAAKGVIWRLNRRTGESSEALSHSLMLPADGQPIPVGVNGLKIRENYIYFTSTTQEIFGRIPIDENASATGDLEIITSGFVVDDFLLLEDGTAYLTTNTMNSILKVSPQGSVQLLAGNAFKMTVAGSTAVVMSHDQSTLYVTTSGALIAPVMCEKTEPGKIVAVSL